MSANDNHLRDVTKKVGFVAGLALLGTVLSRWHGGGFIGGSPKILKNFLWSVPFALAAGAAWMHERSQAVNWTWWLKDHLPAIQALDFETILLCICIAVALLALCLCMVGKSSGHGGGIDDGRSDKEPGAGRDPEKVEYLILWLRPLFHGKHSRWYDRLILALSGLFAVSGAVIAIAMINPLAALPIAIGGAFKAIGYVIGWNVFPDGNGSGPKDFDEATKIGEGLAGLFAFTGLAISVIILLWPLIKTN